MENVRIYRTGSGKHVLEGDPEAEFLAYSQYDNPPDEVLDEVTKKPEPKVDEPRKRGPRPADKSRQSAANKADD